MVTLYIQETILIFTFMQTYDTSLIPVPTNESLKDEPSDLEISSEQLKDWINEHTIWTDG